MRFCIDIRIHAQAYRCLAAKLARDVVESLQFAFRFDVEAQDACAKRLAHLVARLADSGKHRLARAAASRHYSRQFTAGNDVKTAAQAGKQVQDGEIRVGFHRVADKMWPRSESRVITQISLFERRTRIDK